MEPGTWRAVAVSAELGETKGGKDYIGMLIEFVDGPNQGKRSTWYGYFTDKTEERTLDSLMIAGWDGHDINEMAGLGGCEFAVVCENEEYEGKETFKVQWINKASFDAPMVQTKMSDANRLAFAERLKGKTLALKEKNKARYASSAVEANDDDDMPF